MNPGKTPRRVVILKADRTYRDTLSREVRRLWPETEALTFDRGGAALATIQERGADLLIAGVKLVDMDGLEHLEPFVEKPIKIVVVTVRRDERTYRLLKRVRFDAIYDSADEGLDRFADCLETVLAGRIYVSDTVKNYLFEPKRLRNDDVLTVAQELILSVIGDGCDDDQAAERLGLSAWTVQSHRRNIMRKLRLHHRGELFRWAVQRGYVVIDEGGIHRPGFQRILAGQAATAPVSAKGNLIGTGGRRKEGKSR